MPETTPEPRATPTTYLTVDEIVACPDLEEQDVYVPQWKGSVRIRSFTKAQQQDLRRQATDPRTDKIDTDKMELLVFCRGVVEPRFDDIQFLNLKKKSAAAIDTVLRAVFALSGLTPEAAKSGGDALPDG